VAKSIDKALPVSLQLMLYAQLIAVIGGVLLGVLSAYKEGTRTDRIVSGFASLGLSMPSYVLGPILVLFFAVGGLQIFGAAFGFKIMPAARYVYFGADPLGHFRSMLLPAVTLAVPAMATYVRLLRTDMVATLKEDFINVAKAKGMPNRRILIGHALRPSSFTLLTVLGINIGFLIGNGLIIETIFTLPGVGGLIATSIFQRDYLAIQGGVVVLAVGYVFANFVVDLLYAILDPRVRHARAIA
jgi:peptide/nickel transport system permease protein